MTVQVQEELMGQGDWSAEIDHRADIASEFIDEFGRPRKVHALIYDPDDALILTGVLLRAEPDDEGLVIGGRNTLWWLGGSGDGDEGPLIENREHVSGANKLDNGDFSHDQPGFHWTTREPVPDDEDSSVLIPTAWTFHSGYPNYAKVSTNPVDDDVLVYDRDYDVEPTTFHTLSVDAKRLSGSTTEGHIRPRIVYKGDFVHPDLAAPLADWTVGIADIERLTDPTGVITGPVMRVRTDPRELIVNNFFNGGIPPYGTTDPAYGWAQEDPNWGTIVGADGNVARTAGSGPGGPTKKGLRALNPAGSSPSWFFPVSEGEEYFLDGWIYQEPGTDGQGVITCYVGAGEGDPINAWVDTVYELGHGGTDTRWTYHSNTFTVPPGKTDARPTLFAFHHTTGGWQFDKIHFWRTKGNTDGAAMPLRALIPGRSYLVRAPYRSDASVTGGTLQMRALCYSYGSSRQVVVEGPMMYNTEGERHFYKWDFVPPSGYGYVIFYLWSMDVDGGYYYVGQPTVRDNDSSTLVREVISGSAYTAGVTLTRTSGVPIGAQSMHAEIAAEVDANGWEVRNVSLKRIAAPLSTGNAIVSALLTDPATGAASSVRAGTINCPEVVPYDWRIRNLTNRQALDHYCNVVSEPPREYRLNPDRTLDVGTDIFVDHSPESASPIVLLPDDIDVTGIEGVESNAEGQATEVKVLGAEMHGGNVEGQLITATAPVAGSPQLDYNGNPVRRTRLVVDASVDQFRYAQALADELAAVEANPGLSLTATVAGVNTRPAFVPGDWVYVYDPESGLKDPANATFVDGEPVFPRRVRVFGRTRQLGPGYRIDIRRNDGTVFTLGGVRWSDKDETSLTIGERRPEWQADPQAGSTSDQYLRDRALRAQPPLRPSLR
ncbi:MAG: hypothetical protein LC798_03050 [Chloroflexi bacterium]|nr:hypothetical protein [Chloroflexota bacterium]